MAVVDSSDRRVARIDLAAPDCRPRAGQRRLHLDRRRDVTAVDPADRGVAMFQSWRLSAYDGRARYGFRAQDDRLQRGLRQGARRQGAAILHPTSCGSAEAAFRAASASRSPHYAPSPRVFLFDAAFQSDASCVQMPGIAAAQGLDATMICVTHDCAEAMTLTDKIVVLRAGRIVRSARRCRSTTIPTICSSPASSARPR